VLGQGVPVSRVAIIEDHVLVRDALVREVTSLGHTVVLVASRLFEIVGRDDVDLLLLDLDLGDELADPEVVQRLVEDGVRVLVVSALASPRLVRRMIAAGVTGVIAKHDGLEDLRRAIEEALDDRPWMSSSVAQAFATDDSSARPHLSEQELQALQLYAGGLKLDSVARRMGLAPSTVKQYINRVRDKYEAQGIRARTKSELYRIGLEDGFLRSDPATQDPATQDRSRPSES
jgi:DNA-binding NarL/FixJ family response regulator